MTIMAQTMLARHIPQNDWSRTPYEHSDGKWVFIHMKSRLEVREILYKDDMEDGRMMQHLELRSASPVRWEQWVEVFKLWVGERLSIQATGALSWRPMKRPDGTTVYFVLNAWYSYPEQVITTYLEKKDKAVTV